MYRLMVLYAVPADPDHFRYYYVNKHLPLAKEMPNLKAMRYGMNIEALEGKSPYFCIWEGDFESYEAMMETLQSEKGQEVSNDVSNYATGGTTLIHYKVVE
jgi:uncharacterized protein (TIGR02118 family)